VLRAGSEEPSLVTKPKRHEPAAVRRPSRTVPFEGVTGGFSVLGDKSGAMPKLQAHAGRNWCRLPKIGKHGRTPSAPVDDQISVSVRCFLAIRALNTLGAEPHGSRTGRSD
jgi:hypothetical protein